jgi:hypothetical protein
VVSRTLLACAGAATTSAVSTANAKARAIGIRIIGMTLPCVVLGTRARAAKRPPGPRRGRGRLPGLQPQGTHFGCA